MCVGRADCSPISSPAGESVLVVTCRQSEGAAAAASPQQSPGDSPRVARQPAQLVQARSAEQLPPGRPPRDPDLAFRAPPRQPLRRDGAVPAGR